MLAGSRGGKSAKEASWQDSAPSPPLRARGSFQCLVGDFIGENFFVSLVEGGSGGADIIHGQCSYLPQMQRGVSSRVNNQHACWFARQELIAYGAVAVKPIARRSLQTDWG